ncbi:hypothetical protein M8C21_033233 [Ambrosia artemisiifolia]|uniref:Uncharacterized protein n=1 Tax=Ambrosia artemisiifolia TaxID=4212 RepID=A0AAD5GBW5_AMBAR|nr:hypothetical protein M8C21_033233 [Ambrosia artemisiifolia]
MDLHYCRSWFKE